MTVYAYPKHLSLEELATHYAIYNDESCLVELKRRDKLNKMTYDERIGLSFEEPDNQRPIDYRKEVASSAEAADNVSVKDGNPWTEAYEEGFKRGLKFARESKEESQ